MSESMIVTDNEFHHAFVGFLVLFGDHDPISPVLLAERRWQSHWQTAELAESPAQCVQAPFKSFYMNYT